MGRIGGIKIAWLCDITVKRVLIDGAVDAVEV